MHSSLFFVASLALLAVCACAPAGEDVIQHIPPKPEQIPSAIGNDGAKSGALGDVADVSEAHGSATESKVPARARRDVGQESDLLPSALDVDASPFGQVSSLAGRGRIRVLPAYLG